MKTIRGIKTKIWLFSASCWITFQACDNNNFEYDASGIFEAREVIVSAEMAGKLTRFSISEGNLLKANQVVGSIDCDNMVLQKAKVRASIDALNQKRNEAEPQVAILKEQYRTHQKQIAAQQEQLKVLEKEKQRLHNLVKAKAATPKQLDDITGQIDVLKVKIESAESQLGVIEQQIQSHKRMVTIQNRALLSEQQPLEVQTSLLDEQIENCTIKNPINGTVLVKYAEANEMAAPGKALYKIAPLDTLTLRAYITGDQLPQIRIDQRVKVLTDDGNDGYFEHPGRISWIADEAEFTPKTIQTKKERPNLVYAVKIEVPNDGGSLKIGMYAEVLFQNESSEDE